MFFIIAWENFYPEGGLDNFKNRKALGTIREALDLLEKCTEKNAQLVTLHENELKPIRQYKRVYEGDTETYMEVPIDD